MNEDGTGVVNLTRNAASDARPAWSPNGKQIAFASYRTGNSDIYVMDADGTALTRLTFDASGDALPAWHR